MAKTLVYQICLLGFTGHDASPLVMATAHLKYIKELGIDVVAIDPMYAPSWHQYGYSVDDHYQVHPCFGTMAEFDALVEAYHRAGIRVIINLDIDCTSTSHEWFKTHPEFYYRTQENVHGWHWDEQNKANYLYLSNPDQAILNWKPHNRHEDINWGLAKEFHRIIDYWIMKHGIDGFKVNQPKYYDGYSKSCELQFEELDHEEQITGVLNVLFSGDECRKLFLILDGPDPTMGKLVSYYGENTPVDFVMNSMLKSELKSIGFLDFCDLVDQQAESPYFMLNLEDHNSPRFISTGWITHEGMLECMFGSGAKGIYLFQGQELGLRNPTEAELQDYQILDQDTKATMYHRSGELLEKHRPFSCANTRISLPLDKYEKQEQNPNSCFSRTRELAQRWHRS